MDKEPLSSAQLNGFEDEIVKYQNIANIVVSAGSSIINKQSIPYDFDHLKEKLTHLKIVRRDGIDHQYDPDTNTIFVSKYNQRGRLYSDEEMVVFTTHELMHLISTPNGFDEFFQKYYAFDEFFTEYLASLVISNIGGIELESYYKHNVGGYFGNSHDANFIKKLVKKFGFRDILNCYLSRNVDNLENLVGVDTLASMNDYFYFNLQLYKQIGEPSREFNVIITQPTYAPQKQIIDNYAKTINQNI